MSRRDQTPTSRRTRRQRLTAGQPIKIDPNRLDLPPMLSFLTNPKLFVAVGVMAGVAMIIGLLPGVLGSGSTGATGPMQANELADVPRNSTDSSDDSTAPVSATATVKRYAAAPEVTIDSSRKYLATIKTTKGDIQLELYPDQAPEAVNSFVFLARDGYYDHTPFMQVTKTSRFTAQAGDPTRTGLGTPGYSIRKELTSRPFSRGAVGLDSGQFFISYSDQPALTGKHTIIGQVVSGLDVLDKLSLIDVTSRQSGSGGDEVQSVVITES